MSCRSMYYCLRPETMGRTKFEQLCKEHGLSSPRVIRTHRTNDSSGVNRFDNLTVGMKLSKPDELWVSDITYYRIRDKFYFITFIVDAFSRRILGHHVSNRLYTEQTALPALRMGVQARNGSDLTGTIFHSDGGGQYYDMDF